jgi:hypothetical protein
VTAATPKACHAVHELYAYPINLKSDKNQDMTSSKSILLGFLSILSFYGEFDHRSWHVEERPILRTELDIVLMLLYASPAVGTGIK